MRFSRLTLCMVVVVAVSVLAACGASVSADNLTGSKWQLEELNGRDALDDVLVTMMLESDNRLFGTGGCNRYTGTWDVGHGHEITLAASGTTLMACEWQEQAVMRQETAFLEALGNAVSFDTDDDSLRLFNADGREVAEFSSMDPVQLTGTRWEAFGLNNGENAIVSIIDEAIPFAIFDLDGDLSGHTGCNTFNASYSRDGEELTIDPAAVTMMACDDPIAEQETQFLLALEQVATYELGHESLALRAEDGSVLIWFRDAD